MAESNPARVIETLLKAAKSGARYDENGRLGGGIAYGGGGGFGGGGFGGGAVPLRQALNLTNGTSAQSLDALASLLRILDWLDTRIEGLPAARRAKYERACMLVRGRLDYEFVGPYGRNEPPIILDVLITDFEYLASEFDDGLFSTISDEQMEEWEQTIEELHGSIEESPLDGELRELFLDLVSTLKSAVRNLRRYGPVACEERLRNALGRLGLATATAPKTEEDQELLRRAWSIFVGMGDAISATTGMIGVGQSLRDALPSIASGIGLG